MSEEEREPTRCGYAGCHMPSVVTIPWKSVMDPQTLPLCDEHCKPKWWPRDLKKKVKELIASDPLQ